MFTLKVSEVDGEKDVEVEGSNEQMLFDYLVAAVGRSERFRLILPIGGGIRQGGVIWEGTKPRFHFSIRESVGGKA